MLNHMLIQVENATLPMLKVILEYLERQRLYTRILLVDFSSAFNTIQPHMMIRKLIGKYFVMLENSFLTNHSQYVYRIKIWQLIILYFN